MKEVSTFVLLLFFVLAACMLCADDDVVGKRPYELDWANRFQDEDPPLVNFENLDGWNVGGTDMEATFSRTREQQIWGEYVGKLTYRSVGGTPTLSFGPSEPIKIDQPFDAVSCWIYGNNWAWAPNPNIPPAHIQVVFLDSDGKEFSIALGNVNWEEWFLCQRRLTPEQIKSVENGAHFVRFDISNCSNKLELKLYFDNLSVFTEKFAPLSFKPRKKRGIDMFPGQGVGINTGEGKLPFPNSEKTILPSNLTKDFKTTLKEGNGSFVFTYKGSDGTLTYTITPKTGTFGDITASWTGRGDAIRPCVDGGCYLADGDNAVAPERITPVGKPVIKGDTLNLQYRLTKGNISATVTYTYRLWNKSLVIDTVSKGGNILEVQYGHALGIEDPRLVKNPYYKYGSSYPMVVVSGPIDRPLFLTGHTDWYLSNSSTPFANSGIEDNRVTYQGGVRYIKKTDGTRNDCYERFFITISPKYEEILPNIPNPVSPWKHIAGSGVWRAHGASNRISDGEYWSNVYRYGMRKIIITDHETGWRDNGESFTFRTKTAPGRGGDQSQYEYARLLQDKLGFVYGPYNNFTDFAPVNEFWSYDIVTRQPDKQLLGAWTRCYAPKPLRAVEYCELLAPQIQEKFHFSTAYCDVHTAVAPWDRVDYDSRVPGAGTFTTVFYSFGEIMQLQKAAWNGPVYSEGNNHLWYCGLTDGNYGQDWSYNFPDNPWLVDIDLLKMHDLCCNFGMGNMDMFYRGARPGESREAVDAYYDRFLAATVAFGHPGFLTFEGGFATGLRSYFMLQQLHSDYTLASVKSIRYGDENGKLLDTSAAVASGAYKRSQVVTEYTNGTVTVVNGSRTERFRALGLDLPPNGYAGWTKDKSIYVISSDDQITKHRTDYADTPAYIYVDGRGVFSRFEKAASNGIGICRFIEGGKYEVIPYADADCGFKIDADTAVALDKDFNELGDAQVRVSRGLVYIVPVEGAVSYILSKSSKSDSIQLTSERDVVVPGENVVVAGLSEHVANIPSDAVPGQRLWFQFEDSWIDFTCAPLVDIKATLNENILNLNLTSHQAKEEMFTVSVQDVSAKLLLKPDTPRNIKFDLGEGKSEEQYILPVEVSSETGTSKEYYGMTLTKTRVKLIDMPEKFEAGITVRDQDPELMDIATGATADRRDVSCGGVAKSSIFLHPPYIGGVGCSYITYPAVKLPNEKATFKATVGKMDASHAGDGILFQVAVIEPGNKIRIIAEQRVTKHEWLPIEADLTEWAGSEVTIRLISDVGEGDDSAGDWAAWADMRIDSDRFAYVRELKYDVAGLQTEPAPIPLAGITENDIKNAKAGWLIYDGVGMNSDTPEYPLIGVLNGVSIGNLPPGSGDEIHGVWDLGVRKELPRDALAALEKQNFFHIENTGKDAFKIRRFYIELELADGRKASSLISSATYTQPANWLYGEGIKVPEDKQINLRIWFDID